MIIGAGPAGLSLALALKLSGIESEVIERRPVGDEPGDNRSSFNLTLVQPTIEFLQQLGVQIDDMEQPVRGRQIWVGKSWSRHDYGLRDSDVLHSVPRAALVARLRAQVTASGVPIRYGTSAHALQLDEGVVRLEDEQGNARWCKPTAVLIADGANSRLRSDFVNQVDCNVSRQTDGLCYAAINIAPALARGAGLEPSYIHFAPGRAGIDIGIANRDGSMSLLLERPDRPGKRMIESHADAIDFVEGAPGYIRDKVPGFGDRLVGSPVRRFLYALPQRRTYGNFMLVGDAGRTLPPYLGKGANDAFADARALARAHIKVDRDWEKTAQAYERDRAAYIQSIERLARRHGQLLLNGEFGGWRWRMNDRAERLKERLLGSRSAYQRLVFDSH